MASLQRPIDCDQSHIVAAVAKGQERAAGPNQQLLQNSSDVSLQQAVGIGDLICALCAQSIFQAAMS
eukprot:1154884-Pelagomonas_calceolata.AAC.2